MTSPTTIVNRIEEVAHYYPDALAVVGVDEPMTYRELWARARAVGQALRARGVRTGECVGVFAEQGITQMVSLIGIVCANAVYVPLDPTYPKSRLSQMIQDANVSVVLATSDSALTIEALSVEFLDPLGESVTDLPDSLPYPDIHDVAYVIFTSGSTGRPKGVAIEHSSLMYLLDWMSSEFDMGVGQLTMGTASPSFDASLPNCLLPLMSGGTVVTLDSLARLDPRLLAERISRFRPHFLQASPTMLRMLTHIGWPGDSNLTIWSGGERLSSSTIEYLVPRVAQLCNFYGPTEATVNVSLARLSVQDTDSPIGSPAPFARFHIRDGELHEVPSGASGELLIEGPTLAREYLGDSERTEEKFVSLRDGDRIFRAYRSGDLAYRREDGTYQLIGRADSQIKFRGYRIEPGEVEAALMSAEGITDAVVVLSGRDGTEAVLTALVCAPPSLRIREVENHVAALLPEFMVPHRFVALEKFPLTPAGKTDRHALEEIADLERSAHFAQSLRRAPEPEDEIEAKVLAAFATSLDLPEASIDIDASFFDLGGTSFRCVQLFTELEELFDIDLPISTVIAFPTVRGLSHAVRQSLTGITLPGAVEGLPDYDLESEIHQAWAEVLGRDDFSPSDDFFKLGGDSVKASAILDKLNEAHATHLTLREFESSPTVAQLSYSISGRGGRDCLVPLRRTGTRPPFFCVAGAGGLALAFLDLAEHLGSDQPFYGLQSRGLERRAIPDYTFRAMVRRYISEIRSVQPTGPYFLGGHSMGAVVALLVAQELQRSGEDVRYLAVIDGILNNQMAGPDDDAKLRPSDLVGRRHFQRLRWLIQLRPRVRSLIRFPLMGLVRFRGTEQFDVFYRYGLVQVLFARRLSPWNGRTTVFISETDAERVRARWSKILAGHATYVNVHGLHNSILRAPNVEVIAATIRQDIDEGAATS